MKQLTYSMGLILCLFSQFSMANTVILPSPNEPDLIGVGGILDTVFGLGNLQRVDDDLDQYWRVTADEVTATAVAKHAGYKQNFGFINSEGQFSSLLYVPYMNAQSSFSNVPAIGDEIRFGLTRGAKPRRGNKRVFSSDPSNNGFCGWFNCYASEDHMVSWLITDGEYAGDYVLAWEDLKHLGDRDYNDLVVRVSGVAVVPAPAAVFLFGSGLLGLVVVSRRRTF